MTRERARAPKGERAIGKVKRNHGTVTSVLGSLTASGVEAAMTVEGGTSGPVFTTFVEHFLLPNLQPGHVVVLDNVGAHKVRKAKELVESKGAKLLYLPPYHPDLNPIENAWSKIKSCLRAAEARTHEALEEALKTAINSITASDVRGWMTHCGYQFK